jgi:hypothetical protein
MLSGFGSFPRLVASAVQAQREKDGAARVFLTSCEGRKGLRNGLIQPKTNRIEVVMSIGEP